MVSVSVDGEYPAVELLARRVTVNYGHFTSMQVRGHGVKGLDLHLARLRSASNQLHDSELDVQRVRGYLKAALAGTENASARVDVFPGAAEVDEHVMVTISEPEPVPPGPLTLKPVAYQRPVAHIKHAGGFAQIFHQRQARKAGFDDALLVADNGEVSETAIANLGFIRGGEIIWPAADVLHGITWQLVDRILADRGTTASRRPVRLSEIADFEAVFTANSHGITPVSRIGDVEIPLGNETVQMIASLYEAEPFQPI